MAGKIINADGEPFDLDTFRTVVEINLIGSFNVCRLVASRLVRDGKPIPRPDESTEDRGVLINTASAAAFEGQTGQVSYSASKGGVVGMTLPMARDLARYGIRTMTLAPALFSTPMMERLPDKAKKQILRSAEFPVSLLRSERDVYAYVWMSL
jgi:NAD(P)-dependent dehydrogenase (short-subunit alcohol dehydrogenase family)